MLFDSVSLYAGIAVLLGCGMPSGADARQINIEFRMESKSWHEVFKWLSSQTGVPFIGSCGPAGTFTFIGPKEAKYSLPEIVASINQALRQQGFALVRRPRCFTLVAVEGANVLR
jgi:hypothetical protein